MTLYSPATHGHAAAAQPCACGCAPCDNECCELECLVRPRFFCGQLLTDSDLSAMVNWSRARFRLARQRHGWGVVCGLEVTRDPQNPAGVQLAPGYAIDCCGNDIVACEPSSYSLAKLCPTAECRDPHSERRRQLEELRERADVLLRRVAAMSEEHQRLLQAQVDALRLAHPSEDRDRLRAAIAALETEGAKHSPTFADAEAARGDLFSRSLGRAQAIDLFLHYAETGAEPQSTLRGGACGAAECEDSRTREGHRLSHQIVVGRPAPPSDWDDWKRRFDERRSNVFFSRIKAAAEAGEKAEAGEENADEAAKARRAARAALALWLNDPRRAPGEFSFATDRARQISADIAPPAKGWANELPALAFWLYLDDLIGWLACACASCDRADGVPLARVWLAGAENGQPCRVVAIDHAPPSRRPLRRDDCLPARPNPESPAAPGCANLGDLLGWRWEDAQRELGARGIEAQLELVDSTTWAGVQQLLGCSSEALAPCRGATVRALYVDLGGDWGRRVVGFCEPASGGGFTS
jgi:hypothetical protein